MKDDEEGEHNDTCALTLLNHRSKNSLLVANLNKAQ